MISSCPNLGRTEGFRAAFSDYIWSISISAVKMAKNNQIGVT
jgi:hypothetical protein